MATVAGTRARADTGTSPQRPRGPGFAYLALALAIIVAVAALALSWHHPPPPSIAEFAPKAIENIREVNEDGVGRRGSGRADQASGLQSEPSPPPLGAAIDVPRVRKCVGDPPRQIEDPQSPPCVPYWAGDNGGATYKGVTRSEIRVAGNLGATAEARALAERVLEGFFNRRFEFYGRKVTLVHRGVANDCATQKATAVDLDENIHAFAALDMDHAGANCFYTELARRRLMSINASQLISEKEARDLYPYLWQYEMGRDDLFEGIGAMVCARLAHRAATHTPDPLLSGRTRKFGVIVHSGGPAIPVDVRPLIDRLRSCRVDADPIIDYYPDPNDSARLQTDTENAVLQMKTKNVTSVICICAIFTEVVLGPTATQQAYFPEWITSSYGSNDYNLAIKAFWSPEHRVNMFGVSAHNHQINFAQDPYAWAMREVDPGVYGADAGHLYMQYWAMMVLASGIQMAGPTLTPSTFAAGLHRTRFPNPEHPNLPAKVGFLGPDHTMTNDLNEYWWSETDRGPDGYPQDGSVGALCYVDGGARRTTDRWPSDPDPFFSRPCITGA